MSGLIEAARTAARGLSLGVRQLGRAPSPRRLRNWLIPPSTPRGGGSSLPGSGNRLAIVRIPVPIPVPVPSSGRPPQTPGGRYTGQGTSRPQAASVWWSYPVPATLDSTVFGAPIAPIHPWPRRLFMLAAAMGALLFGSATALAQCGGSGCGGCCSPGICSAGICSMGNCSPAPNCCCPSGGCGFGCSAGCGCPRATFGLGWFGGGRCCSSPCGSCCGSGCGGYRSCGGCRSCGSFFGPCGAPCGCAPCGPSCGSPCGCAPCGLACGSAFCGGPVCGGSICAGPACGLACGPPCGMACGPSWGPSCGPACGPGGCGSCGASGLGAPGSCGGGCSPLPTYETNPALPPGATNHPGYPLPNNPTLPPGDPIPGAPATTIPKRQPPPGDKGTRFERRPGETSNTAAATDLTQAVDPSELSVPRPSQRLFRQSVSAGFHTRVVAADSGRSPGWKVTKRTGTQSPRTEGQLARIE